MKLILARHGETEFNRLRKFYGTADVKIDEKGKEQAKLLATYIRLGFTAECEAYFAEKGINLADLR